MSPPNRTEINPNEGNILLAILVIHSSQRASISAAARAYNVSKATLARRIKGSTSREVYTPANKQLINIKENGITGDILKLDAHGLPSTASPVR